MPPVKCIPCVHSNENRDYGLARRRLRDVDTRVWQSCIFIIIDGDGNLSGIGTQLERTQKPVPETDTGRPY